MIPIEDLTDVTLAIEDTDKDGEDGEDGEDDEDEDGDVSWWKLFCDNIYLMIKVIWWKSLSSDKSYLVIKAI